MGFLDKYQPPQAPPDVPGNQSGNEGGDEDTEFVPETPEQKRDAILEQVQGRINSFFGDLSELSKVDEMVQEAFRRDPDPHFFLFLPDLFSSDVATEVTQVFAEIRSIVQEKGFRFGPSLISGREHIKIGSSGYKTFEDEDPDVPVPLLQPKLAAAGKIKPLEETPMPFEEVDRGRRLAGMTVLDPSTQRTTNETDPVAAGDSYHYLSPERKLQIQARETEIRVRVNELAQHSLGKFESVRDIKESLRQYIDGGLSSPEMQARYDAAIHLMSDKLKERSNFDLTNLIKESKAMSFEMGKRDKILTPQEIKLRVGGQIESRYEANPYRPLAVQDGASIEEIANLRKGEATMVVTNEGVMTYARPWGFRLEELEPQTGDTLQSPSILDSASLERVDFSKYGDYAKEVTVPFARTTDWFYKEAN